MDRTQQPRRRERAAPEPAASGAQRRCVLIVGGGVLTLPLIERARQRGLEVIVLDRDPQAPGFALADRRALVSTKDPVAAAEAARALHRARPVHGVLTAGADVEVTVAAIAEALGLPGPSARSARLCNDKAAMREHLAAAGLPQPRFARVGSAAAARSAARELGFPLIVKPLDNCGSRGVQRIEGPDALGDAVERALSLSLSEPAGALLEEYVEGTTHTVETLIDAAGIHVCSVIDTVHGFAPWAVELEHHNPTRRSPRERDALVELALRALRAVGVEHGPAKVDLLFPPSGPQVMEMTARLSGGFHCQWTTPLAHGTDNLNAALDACLGERPDPLDWQPRRHHFAVCAALFPEPGRIVALRGLDEARRIPGVAHVVALAAEGDVLPPYHSSADRRFFVIASGSTPEARDRALARARACIRITTEPVRTPPERPAALGRAAPALRPPA